MNIKYLQGDIWHELLNYETLDLVGKTYQAKHKRKPSKRRIDEIISNFIQAREYFVNAENSSLSVKPLLFYYGVLGLSRGFILLMNPSLSESAMKKGHGLNTLCWQETLTDKLCGIGNLKVNLTSGTFRELLETTKNKSYLKNNCSAVNFRAEYEIPKIGSHIIFQDLVETFPDVAGEYEIWKKKEAAISPVNKLNSADKGFVVEIPKNNNTSIDKIKSIFSRKIEVEEKEKSYLICINEEEVFLTQLFKGNFNIGDVYIGKTLSDNMKLAIIPSLYCISYYLGMLSRYFPSIWLSLSKACKGDSISPLIHKLLILVRDRYPESILAFLKEPYPFD